MRITNSQWRYENGLMLGTVSDDVSVTDSVIGDISKKARLWKPAKAKSFTFSPVKISPYGIGYEFTFWVSYYTVKHEGTHQL